jgi:hypothetical protein
MKHGAEIAIAACQAGFPPACELQKRIPPDVVQEVLKSAPPGGPGGPGGPPGGPPGDQPTIPGLNAPLP